MDGQITYSNIITLTFLEDNHFKIWHADNSVFLESEEQIGAANFIISDLLGRIVFAEQVDILAGQNEIPVNNKFPSGVYIFQINDIKLGKNGIGKY